MDGPARPYRAHRCSTGYRFVALGADNYPERRKRRYREEPLRTVIGALFSKPQVDETQLDRASVTSPRLQRSPSVLPSRRSSLR